MSFAFHFTLLVGVKAMSVFLLVGVSTYTKA